MKTTKLKAKLYNECLRTLLSRNLGCSAITLDGEIAGYLQQVTEGNKAQFHMAEKAFVSFMRLFPRDIEMNML